MAKDFKNKVGAGNPILNGFTGAKPQPQESAQDAEKAPEISAGTIKGPIKKKAGKPKTRGKIYRINLALDADLEDFLKAQAWKEHKSVTELLNDLARDYKNRVEG